MSGKANGARKVHKGRWLVVGVVLEAKRYRFAVHSVTGFKRTLDLGGKTMSDDDTNDVTEPNDKGVGGGKISDEEFEEIQELDEKLKNESNDDAD